MTIKNISEQGGDKWIVGGVLFITKEGKLVLDDIPITRATNQVDSNAATIADLKADFNALLAKLKVAGLMDHG